MISLNEAYEKVVDLQELCDRARNDLFNAARIQRAEPIRAKEKEERALKNAKAIARDAASLVQRLEDRKKPAVTMMAAE